MFAACADPKAIEGLTWLTCYLTSGKHLDFYWSFVVVLGLLAITAPAALTMGFLGATAARSRFLPLSLLGKGYAAIVRGVPDIVFFLFFVIALDQGIEYLKSLAVCDDPGWPSGKGWSSASARRPRSPLARPRRSGTRRTALAWPSSPLPSCSGPLPPTSFMARWGPCPRRNWKRPRLTA